MATLRVVIRLADGNTISLSLPAPDSPLPANRPPSAAALAALPRGLWHPATHAQHNPECGTCLCDFEIGEGLCTLPCGHFFHESCIRPWLEENNTCPTCRTMLPTSDSAFNCRHNIPPLASTAARAGGA